MTASRSPLALPFRDPGHAQALTLAIARTATQPWVLMEVCGGQTHSIVRYGLDDMLPAGIELVHGPGCPVCVTPLQLVDHAHALAQVPGVTFCSFGDMLRVPGSRTDLLRLQAAGADVRVVYSPLDAVALAESHPQRQVVFFAIGFETTAPANAMAIELARRKNLSNFTVLVSQVLVPPAVTSILQAPDNRVQALLGPGHVCTITGTAEYAPIAKRYGIPVVVAGFEPIDLLQGILWAIRQLEEGRAEVEVPYARAVTAQGNAAARELVDRVYEVCDRPWRGLGNLPKSGLRLRWEYRDFDAARRFGLEIPDAPEPAECMSGAILRGIKKPCDCPAFGVTCTPRTPLGATMVSGEGACSAWFAAGRHLRQVGAVP